MFGYVILILTALIVGTILYGVWLSSDLTGKQTRMLNAWAHIDAQLKHRHDAVRDLVTAMRTYLTHDHQTLEEVSRDRLSAIEAGSNVPARALAENALTKSVRLVINLAGAYPQMMEESQVRALQTKLMETEQGLVASREAYNEAAREYNASIRPFPASVMATRLRLTAAVVFNLEPPPSVGSTPMR